MVQDLVRYRFVERASVTEPPEIKLQGLQFHAVAIGYIFQMQGREVRLAGLRAQTGELGDPNAYGVIPLRVRVNEPLKTTFTSGLSGSISERGHCVGPLAGESSETSFCRAFYFTLAPSKQLSRPDYLLD